MAEAEAKRGDSEQARADLKAQLDAKLAGLYEKMAATPREELAGPLYFWDVYAIGPGQVPGLQPSRIIEVGELAWCYVWVYLNPFVPDPAPGQNACDIITGFGGKIQLNFFTSNTQTMTPVPALSEAVCIPTVQTVPHTCWYSYLWEFTPQEPACLYETNICARICNCNNVYVPQYAGFVRWVENLDFDLIFGAPAWTFDHPIRYMVADSKSKCPCP